MRNAFKSLLLAFTTLCAGVVAYAQVTTSALSGRVVDQTGQPVVGAAILAQHEPSGTVYGAITNADGRYTIQGMRTGGPYNVEFSCLGYGLQGNRRDNHPDLFGKCRNLLEDQVKLTSAAPHKNLVGNRQTIQDIHGLAGMDGHPCAGGYIQDIAPRWRVFQVVMVEQQPEART